MGRRRVAGNDEGLDSLIGEERCDLATVAPDGLGTLRPIRNSCGVAKIRHALVRELTHHLVGDGEAADPGIEDANRRAVRHHVSFAPTLAPPGAARI